MVGALSPEPHKVTSGLELHLYGHAQVSGSCHQQGYTKFMKSTVYMILAMHVKNAQLLNSTGSELTKQLQPLFRHFSYLRDQTVTNVHANVTEMGAKCMAE